MAEILAEAGRITGLGPEIGGTDHSTMAEPLPVASLSLA